MNQSQIFPQVFSTEERRFHHTSESVGEGHPDKICDQISDAILDACLTDDPLSSTAVEVTVNKDFVHVFGFIRTGADINVELIVRHKLRDIGYDQRGMDIHWETCTILDQLFKHMPNIGEILQHPVPDTRAGDQVRRYFRLPVFTRIAPN